MRNLSWIFILVFLHVCKEHSKTFFQAQSNINDTLSANFYFGEWKNYSIKEFKNKNLEYTWGYFTTRIAESFCFQSHSPWFFEKEKGPKFLLCLKEREKEQISRFLSEYVNQDSIFEVLKLELAGSEIKIYFLNSNEVLKEFENTGSFLLGEKELCEEASKFYPQFAERQYCTSGKHKNLETSFSLPYFSLLEQKENFLILFPPSHFRFGKNRRYLVVELEKNSHIEKIFFNFFLEISQKQNIFNEKCKIGQIEFSEGMGVSNSHTGKFLELFAKNEEVLCFHEFQIQIESQRTSLIHPTGYLLPESYLLLVPEDSRLEGEPYPEIDWKRLQKGKSLKLFQNGNEEVWQPSFLGGVYPESEFSSSKREHTCQHKGTITQEKNFCGTPGSPNEFVEFSAICELEGFELSEWNSKGIFLNDRLESTGKFLELVWNKSPNCKGDFFLLQTGNLEIPFNLSLYNLSQNQFLLFGSETFFHHSNLVPRSLGNLSVNNNIVLYDRFGNSKTLYEKKENEFYISQTSNGVYSLIKENSQIKFHSNVKTYLNNQNFMSPGTSNLSFPALSEEEKNQFYISEYNSRGSYTQTESIPEDKFIEIYSPYKTQLELILKYSKGEFSYSIPVENEYTVLAKEKLYCSTYESTVIENDLLFPFEDVTWNIKIDNTVIHSKTFSKTNASFENRKDRIRKSSVYTFPNLDWEFSNLSHPSLKPACQGYTYASPGFPNSFEPLLVQNSELAWKIYFSKDFYLPINLNIQSIFPNSSLSFPIYPQYPFVSFSLPSLWNANLFYVSLENASHYAIYQKERFLIQAVLPNPENPQNEWVLLCNQNSKSFFIEELLIQDQTHSDILITWNSRFSKLPTSNTNFNGTERELKPKQCAYVLDPDANEPYLFQEGEPPTFIWTVRDSSIGNGIGNTEGVDIFQVRGTERIHLHSFRNFLFGKPWQTSAGKGEIFYLKPNQLGVELEDYEIRKEVLP